MIVLGLESTCDETACAVVRSGKEILSNIVASQIDLHAKFGGVVPELACRKHLEAIIPVIDEAIKKANISLVDIDLIAVANGPGLIGALLIGLNAAKALSLALNKPFIGINHIEAHLFAATMTSEKAIEYPCLGVVLSGGHTVILKMNSPTNYETIGQTVDDAIGEAFDKVAKMLELPYPGGPEIEKLALKGNPKAYPFHSGKVKNNPFDFSFSGLKTAVLYAMQKRVLDASDKADLAASFQEAAFKDVYHKVIKAATEFDCKTLLFGGGVTNNKYLRTIFAKEEKFFNLIWPSPDLTLDNAAMIAGLGFHLFNQRGSGDPLSLESFTFFKKD